MEGNVCGHPMNYFCNFRKAVALWGPEAPRRLPGLSRDRAPFIKKSMLPFPPTAGMGVQLEADEEAYIDVEHVYFDIPEQVFVCRCKDTDCDSPEEYERKKSELIEFGFEKE